MKTKSELQEEHEIRRYMLRHKNPHEDSIMEQDLIIEEDFYYYTKRGQCFPAQYTRNGRQYIEIQNKNGKKINGIYYRNVSEATTARKNNIWAFLRSNITNLKDYQCDVSDKIKPLNDIVSVCEFVEQYHHINKTEWYLKREPQKQLLLMLHFNNIGDYKREELIKALTPYVKKCCFRGNELQILINTNHENKM